MSKVQPPRLEVPEAEVTKASVVEPKKLAVLASKPAADEPDDESKGTALPPLPPLRNQGEKALHSLDHLDHADLALASLQMSVQTSAVRHIAADVEPTSSEETEQDNDDADKAAPLRQRQSNRMDPAVPEIIVPNGANVCEVMMFHPREIALIGRQPGTMQLDFWYDGQGIKRTPYSVTVQEDPTSHQASLEDSQRVETVIHQLFPGSRIECQREPARLIVRGYARNERQAIDIISTIRRSQLIPVIDLIEIRSQDR